MRILLKSWTHVSSLQDHISDYRPADCLNSLINDSLLFGNGTNVFVSVEFRRFVYRNLEILRRNSERLAMNKSLDIVEEDFSEFEDKLPMSSVRELTIFDKTLNNKDTFDKMVSTVRLL